MDVMAGTDVRLHGRASECARLDSLAAALRRGQSRALVVRGEAGIGKTALLDYLAASAADVTVVRVAGIESEMELPFAGLHQLCAPLLGQIGRLPAPQQRALEVVFGLSAGDAPDRFLVGLAVLSLCTAAAEDRPLLCVIDDAQWLDRASDLTLAFVTRRLLAEPVGIVFGAREPSAELRHLPALTVRGLRDSDARALLTTALRFPLDNEVRDRIVAETRGNPLALLELPRGLTAAQLAGGFGLPTATTLTGPLEENFVRRLAPLGDDARRLLLLAAAEPTGDPLLLWRAAGRLGIASTSADAAETAGLLSIGERVTFRHPLARSASYRSASPAERRAAHVALAAETDRENDPDRRAWHLAAAAMGPDEQVARELERSASRARARGGLAAAAAFLRRAVALTKDPSRRVDRALAAARASMQAGDFDAALGLAAVAEAGPPDDAQRARIALLRAQVAFAAGQWTDALPLLSTAAGRLVPIDLDLARETYLTAWSAAGLTEDANARDILVDACRAVRALPPPAVARQPRDLLLDALTLLVTEGFAAAAPRLRQAQRAVAGIAGDDVLRWGWAAVGASAAIWDDAGLLAICARQAQVARDAGALAALPAHLTELAMATAWTGDFTAAGALVEEIDSVTSITGTQFPPYASLRLLALRGQEDEAAPAIAGAIERFGGRGMTAIRAKWATAVLYNGLAQYEKAAAAAAPVTERGLNHWVSMWVLPECVEAAARSGNDALARDALKRLAESTQACGSELALGMEARCEALLSDGTTAETLYHTAIERLRATSLRTELARAHLLYGEWLRRARRRADAREQLRTAYELLTAIGMAGFAERARRELRATGDHVRARRIASPPELTAQERQIAVLAGDRLSNLEIGARLFLSPRTVEWHLANVFSKLGISSRRELASTLAGSRVAGDSGS